MVADSPLTIRKRESDALWSALPFVELERLPRRGTVSAAVEAKTIEADSKSRDNPESVIVVIVIVGIGLEACLWTMVVQKKQKQKQFEDGVVLVERTKLCDGNADADEAKAEHKPKTVKSRFCPLLGSCRKLWSATKQFRRPQEHPIKRLCSRI